MPAEVFNRSDEGVQFSATALFSLRRRNCSTRAAEVFILVRYIQMKELLLKESVLHADETTLQVLKTKDKPTTTKSYMWLYRTSGCCETPIVLYDYRPNRKA